MNGWVSVWVPLPPAAWARRPVDPVPFPLAEPGCALFEEGRDAVWQGVRALGLRPGDEVLSPAYHAGPDVEAMVRAGLTMGFYAGDEDLVPVDGELDALITPNTRALYLVHYTGFPQDGGRWRQWCDQRDLLLIEDAAQSWLSAENGIPVGSFGDLALWSVYKMVPTPNGAVAICSHPLDDVGSASQVPLGRLTHMHGAWLGQRWGMLKKLSPKGDDTEFDAIAHFELAGQTSPPPAVTRYLMNRLGDASVAISRRANYRRLLERLERHVPRPFSTLPDGACPWFFPVETTDKRGLISHLAARGIGAMDVWSAPHPALNTEQFPNATWRRASTVALPVHHELRSGDAERIAAAAAAWYER